MHTQISQEETVGPASWRDIRTLLASVVLLLMLANGAASWFLKHHPATPNLGYHIVAAKWKLLLGLQQPVDWLILGDSSGNQGVVPEILQERLGVRAVNLCTIGSMLVVGDAWMLETYLQRVGVPQAVVLVHAYDVWDRQEDELLSTMMYIPLPWGFWYQVHPPLVIGSRQWARLALVRYVPLYADNRSLSRVLQWPWRLGNNRHDIQPDGYMPWRQSEPDEVERDFADHVATLRDNKSFRMSSLNSQALARIRTLAETYSFDVYLTDSPLYEGLYHEPDFQRYFEQLHVSLRAYAATSPWIRYLGGAPQLFSKDQMVNADHLVDVASQIYTRGLVDKILAEEPATRYAQGSP